MRVPLLIALLTCLAACAEAQEWRERDLRESERALLASKAAEFGEAPRVLESYVQLTDGSIDPAGSATVLYPQTYELSPDGCMANRLYFEGRLANGVVTQWELPPDSLRILYWRDSAACDRLIPSEAVVLSNVLDSDTLDLILRSETLILRAVADRLAERDREHARSASLASIDVTYERPGRFIFILGYRSYSPAKCFGFSAHVRLRDTVEVIAVSDNYCAPRGPA